MNKNKEKKRVYFNEDKNIYFELLDPDGSLKESRNGQNWILDNLRFKMRIKRVEQTIEPVLIKKLKLIKLFKQYKH